MTALSLCNLIATNKTILTPELLSSRWREFNKTSKIHATGHCQEAPEALWHLTGGKESAYEPHIVTISSGEHWFLKHKETGEVLDPTLSQFKQKPVAHHKGRKKALFPNPSMRAQIIIDRVRIVLNQSQTVAA